MSLDKYDRQTRLWGEGQILISQSRILCFNSDGASTEILKNLILAGAGYVALVDNKLIKNEDLKENFFINKEDVGKNRAEFALQNLLELNPDSKGNYYNTSPEEFLENYSLQIATFDIIIVSNKQDIFNNKVILLAEKNSQRVILIRNFGLINYMRLYENFHGSLQLRLLDNPINDLRIANPWEELKKFCLNLNLEEMEEIKHKNIPYIVILIQALEQYKSLNQNNNPNTTQEKNQFKNLLKTMIKYPDEENFSEALNFYYFVNKDKLDLITPEISEIFEILKENSIEDLLKKTNVIMSNFFIICKAIQIFYEKFDSFPVVGNISDMTSDTETYITLKKIYDKKGKEDRLIINKLVNEIIQSINDDSLSLKKELIKSSINSEEINYIEIICKNWPQIHLFHYPTIQEEERGTHIIDNDFDEDHHKNNFVWYLLIKSADHFYEKFKRYPGDIENNKFEDDIIPLKESLLEYLDLYNKIEKIPFKILELENLDDFIYEFCRMSNSKIVPAISIISSIASQEIIKFITYQFKSINNTIIFDGINTSLSTFKF